MAPKVAIYARISRDAEDEGLGVARQVEDCTARADREGWEVVQTYVDNDVSASTGSTKARPSYDRMFRDARAKHFDMILAYSNSRLTRRPLELEDVIKLHTEYGTRILTIVSGDDDLSTADGRMVARIKSNIDAAEAERTSERLQRKHAELAASGAHIGPRPFGWDFRDDRSLVINPAEAAVLRECVQRVLAGEGLWKITKDLNERGIPTSTGKTWATQVLRRVLLRWRNCGVRTHKGKEAGIGQWDPIIDRVTHERVVALLTDPARKTNNRGTEAKYLLTSVAYCGVCGGHVVGTSEYAYKLKNGRTRVYPHSYKCPASGCMKVQRRMADVDEHVSRVLLGVLQRDGVQLLGGDQQAADEAGERISALEAKLALAADQFADDTITGDQLQRITERLRPQLDAERTKLRRAQPETALAGFAGPDVAEAWGRADVETRKQLIRRLGMRITIHPIGPGNARAYDPNSVRIEWDSH